MISKVEVSNSDSQFVEESVTEVKKAYLYPEQSSKLSSSSDANFGDEDCDEMFNVVPTISDGNLEDDEADLMEEADENTNMFEH